MPPIKRKRCCVPHCPNVQELSKKQFFKIGANLEIRDKWLVGKAVLPKSQLLFCCEDHFDLPNDAENFIRYKYCSNTKLKLRANALPHRKLPLNVCRLCLNLIYNGDDLVDISKEKGGENAKIIATLLPEIDLSMTIEPVVCIKCFDPLEKYYKIKQNVLKTEIIIVNCIKSIVKRSPRRLIKACEIDLFDEYNDIKELLDKEKEKNKIEHEEHHVEDIEELIETKREIEGNAEEIVIQVEELNETKYHIVEMVHNQNQSLDAEDTIADAIINTTRANTTDTTMESNSANTTDTAYEIIQEPAEANNENIFMDLE